MSAPGLSRLTHEELAAVLAVTRHLAAAFELRDMLAEVAQAACRLLHAERASVWLLDAAAQDLVLEVSSDLPPVHVALGHGIVGACAVDRRPINVPDCYADPRFDRTNDLRSGFRTRCCLALPLIDHRDALVGVMQVLNRAGGPFDADDVALAEALAAQCAVALARARLTAEAIEAEHMRQELALAGVVQASALPRGLPAVPGYEMHATFVPAAQTGGDSYDLATVGDQLLVVLADATGHGIAPALSVMQMQAMLRMAFRLGASLETVFAHVNDRLTEILPDGHFVTAFVGLLDPATHALRFLSGGQAPILHYRAAARDCTVFKATSFPMGAMRLDRPRPPVEIELAPGDWLLLLSDGVYEYEDGDGVPFGRARVAQLVRAHATESPAALAARLADAVAAHARGAAQGDDITMLLLKRSAVG